MNSLRLRNNEELLAYLLVLAERLRVGGQSELAGAVLSAGRFAQGSPSEFLDESQLVLERVSNARLKLFTTDEQSKLDSVIGDIKAAFRNVGGA